MTRVTYREPDSLEDALALLGQHGDQALPVAGGLSVATAIRQRRARPSVLIGLRRLEELRGIARSAEGGLRIGALTTHREAERSPLIGEHAAALADAFKTVGTIRIRNQGTVGGNVAERRAHHDPPAVLLVLGGTVELQSPRGPRRVPVEEFLVDGSSAALATDELVVAVHVPALGDTDRVGFVKFAEDAALGETTILVAAAIGLSPEGVCRAARLCAGAVAPTYLRLPEAEQALIGQSLTPEVMAQAAQTAAQEAAGVIWDGLRHEFLLEMVGVWTERALRSAMEAQVPTARAQPSAARSRLEP